MRRWFQIQEQVQRREQQDGFLGLCQVVRGRRGEGQLGQREAWAGIFPLVKMEENQRKWGFFWYVMCFGEKYNVENR